MGMQQKLEREYNKGFEAGKKAAQPYIEMKGAAAGAQATWELIEEMIPKLDGIGPKTQEKILKAIQKYANEEKKKYI
jgi:hypothetical protein